MMYTVDGGHPMIEQKIAGNNSNNNNNSDNSNDSIAIGVLWGLGGLAHPCPLCILGPITLIMNGIKEKFWKRK